MKKGTGGIIERALSGAALIGLMMLSLFVGQTFGTTEVYNVPARFTTHTAGQYSSLTQYFRMTCDSVLSVSFFNGWYPGQGTFWAELRDSATGALAWSGSRNTADSLKYKDVGFMVNTGVTRGKTYKLIVGYTYGFGGTDYHLDVYYDSTNAYPYGYMYPYYGNVDLCARVAGVNRIPPDFWGNNWELGDFYARPTLGRIYAAKADSIGAKWNREWFLWWVIDTAQGGTNWGRADSAVQWTLDKGDSLIGVLFGTPKWCTTGNDTTSADIWPPPWSSHPPKNLFLPVWQNGSINSQNYWGYYVYRAVTRFKDQVKLWEIWNEENSRNFWTTPDPQYAGDTTYQNYRTEDSLIALYDRLVRVAACAAHKADPNAKIFLGGVSSLMITGDAWERGYDWLKKVYQRPGLKDSLNFISFHDYFPASYTFQDSFDIEIDSLRSLMRANGDTLRPVWLTEFGWSTLGGPEGWKVDWAGQADRLVKAYTLFLARLGNPRGHVDKVQWYNLKDSNPGVDTIWGSHGLIKVDTNKCAWYAQRQHNAKLKNLYFNRIVPRPDTLVHCYEFQVPGADTMLKTWCLWLNNGAKYETLAVRTNVTWLVTRDTGATYRDSVLIDTNPLREFGKILDNGKIVIYDNKMDTVPRYLHEIGSVSRPDVVVDSIWTTPTSPRAGEGLRFYARIKNISTTDSLKASITSLVKFQVDCVTKATYQAQRGLTKQGDPLHLDTLTVGYYGNSTNGGESWDRDWTATYGDHLIRAWADSSDKYVELREDNNQGYLFKHIAPKVSLIINSNHKYSNHLANDSLSIVMNGNTSPLPDSAKLLHEGSWTKLGVYGTRDTIVSYSGNGAKFDSVKVFQGGESYTGGDSIIVDASAPYTLITTPVDSQIVNGNSVEFAGFSYDFEYHDSLWEITENSEVWARGYSSVGNAWLWMPGTFGYWNADSAGGVWHTHVLKSLDLALNAAYDTVHVQYVSPDDDGDSFASGFGSFGSSPMNLATDPKGNVYIAVAQENKIRKHSPKKDSLFAFSTRRGNDSSAVTWPMAMACAPDTSLGQGVLWIADGLNHCLKQFDRQGNLLKRFGSFGSDSAGKFKQPSGIALDHKGRLFVVDRGNNRIQVYDTTGAFLFGFGGLGRDSGKMNSPTGIAITRGPETSSGRRFGLVYVTDTKNNQVQVFDSLGNWKKTIRHPDTLGFDTPTGICTDKHGNVFITDSKNHRIVELNPFGKRLFIFGKEGDSLCQFKNPIGVAASPGAHFLYVADAGNRRVTRFTVIRGDTLGGGGPQGGAGVQVLPMVYELGPAIPNPSKGQTTFRYALPKESRVNMTFYNVAGQVVKEINPGKQKAGYYSLTWDGRNNQGHKVGPGVYFYRLTAGNWVKTRKMIVIR